MTDATSIDPAAKQGPEGDYWVNVLLPPDALAVDAKVSFSGDPESADWRVRRVLAWPLDPAKRLYHLEKETRFA